MAVAKHLAAAVLLVLAALVAGSGARRIPAAAMVSNSEEEGGGGLPLIHMLRPLLGSGGHLGRRDAQPVPFDSWRFTVETNTLRGWSTIPARYEEYVGNYMLGGHNRSDSRAVFDEAVAYAEGLALSGNGTEVWVFDVDETMLSNLPYYAKHGFGGPEGDGPAAGVPDAGLARGVPPRAPPAAGAASWGTAPGTKTLLNIFLELSHGDCALHALAAPRVVRAVHVATVRICNRHGACLVETRQLLSDGRVRSHGPRMLSEKMRPGESPEAAAARMVREELRDRARVRILGGDGPRVEERESASYPGLPTRYVLYAVDAEVVDGVPEEGAFDTEDTGEDDGDAGVGAITVKRHYWEWIKDDDVSDGRHKEEQVEPAAGA